MTNKNYYTSNNYTSSPIPSREEFHRFTSNELDIGDFCTNYSSGYQINRVAKALRWTIGNEKQRYRNSKYKY